MVTSTEIPVEEARKYFIYDPDSGLIFNKVHRKGSRGSGKPSGTINNCGYIAISLNRKKLLGHRLAWAIFYGENPKSEIDHINGNRSDNRIINLRVVTRRQNHRNMLPKIKGKVPGLRFRNGKWTAQARNESGQVHIGTFASMESAVSALKDFRDATGYTKRHSAIE